MIVVADILVLLARFSLSWNALIHDITRFVS